MYGLAALIAWAGSQGGVTVEGVPVFALCALLIFALQWLAFIPAYLAQTERFYDLTGSLTYILATVLALVLAGSADPRSLLMACLVILWALRLGTFLFYRIHRDGGDSRFDKIKPDPLRFFFTWSMQGLWVLLTAGAVLAAISSAHSAPLGLYDLVALGLWLIGFSIEVIADAQKRRFREHSGPDAFINSGLWARSRHPNYFGEILLWFAMAMLALPALAGWSLLTLVSPLFVYALLTRVSGVPLLERKADKRWGQDPQYLQYKAQTPLLVPRLLAPAARDRAPQ